MKRALSNAALSGAIVCAAPACMPIEQAPHPTTTAVSNQPNFDFLSAPVTVREREDISMIFTADKAYWLHRHVAVAATKLAIIDGKNVFQCGPKPSATVTSTDFNGLDFCRPNNTIVLSRIAIDAMELDVAQSIKAQPYQVMELIIDHEMGHAVQQADGEKAPMQSTAAIKATELQADCYAGESLRAIDPSALHIVPKFHDYFWSPDPTHGTPTQRTASELQGAETGNC